MKKIIYIIIPICIIFSLLSYHLTYAGALKWIRVGRYQTKVIDSGDQGESSGEGTFGFSYYDGFRRATIDAEGWEMGCKNWTHKDGTTWPIKVSGAGYCTADELIETMPVRDEEGFTIRRYMEYQPPNITVDGFRLDEPFPMKGDGVDASKTPGTADCIVTSQINTSMGVTVDQKVFGWSQKNHDQYMIYDWTLTNTGIVDLEGTQVSQTLNNYYFMRITRHRGPGRVWCSAYGEYTGDSLRIVYSYTRRIKGSTFDNFGVNNRFYQRVGGRWTRPRTTNLQPLTHMGEAMLHVDKSPSDPSDDPSQPQMTTVYNSETPWQRDDPSRWGPVENGYKYYNMQFGLVGVQDGLADAGPYITGVSPDNGTPLYPGTHHTVRHDHMGYKFIEDLPWYLYDVVSFTSSGPYTLGPGGSIRIVWATIMGVIEPKLAKEKEIAWANGTLEPPPGCEFGIKDNLPPQYKKFPELYAADSKSTEYNNWAKDCWVSTGRDSLFQNAWSAQWAVRNNYDVPVPPPAPSIVVQSMADRIKITWDGTESEKASDFAGYRVYRANGDPDYSLDGTEEVGVWIPIFEVTGKGTYSYNDATAERGKAYYYYVSAFDDGVGNKVDVNGKKESLESGRYLNRTTVAAHLSREAATSLSEVRVVPNPYNINASQLQYSGEPDKIMFLDLPPFCTIKIYTESGDLVKTLYHTNGSGDESWGRLKEEHSATEDGQLIVSGIYIAVIEENNEDGTPTGERTFVKFVIVR